MSRRVDDDYSVHSRCSASHLIDDQFKSIASCSDPRVSWCVELGRSDSSSSAALHWSSFSNGLGPTIDSDPIPRGSRTSEQKDGRRPWDIFIFPTGERIQS